MSGRVRARDFAAGAAAGRLALSLTIAAIAAPAIAQTSPAQTSPPLSVTDWIAPTPSPALQQDLAKADAGNPAPLVALADAGNTDAQYYAGMMYVFGRGGVAKDGPKGCAYAEQAAKARADAMFLLGRCFQSGAGGTQDNAKAETAFGRATEMGFGPAKCALGQMLMSDPHQAARGLALCKEAADAGDVDAQAAVANAYFAGVGVRRDRAEARRWYEKAAAQGDTNAARRLGEMYARGDGGPKDTKQAVKLWQGAEKAGDPMAAILVADQLFADLTGGRKPGPGTYAFRGGVPVADLEAVEAWYKQAAQQDPRIEVRERATYAIAILEGIKKGAQTTR
jgi:TPR repeat protein